MKKQILIAFTLALMCGVSKAQSNSQISISVSAVVENYHEQSYDEWIHFKLIDSISSQVYYDSLLTFSATDTFHISLDLPNSLYKCDVLDISANVSMPKIKLSNDSIVKYGYPNYDYYLFQLPVE